MRFDDRLATALAQAADSPAARQAVWRQLVDLLGQPDEGESELRALAFERLRAWRGEVPIIGRQSAALLLLASQPIPADLIEFFAEDATAVSAPLLAGVTLRGADWRALIPRLSPVARALLRHRRDLPGSAVRTLDAYGQADLVLSGPALAPEPESARYAAPDIGELRARVDAFRDARSHAEPARETEFALETGTDGVIRWCDSAAPAAIIGLSIAEALPGQAQGVDGQAAGAFRRRAPFRDARLAIAGAGPAGGDWSISGVPVFDPATGRFQGYRGTARRPRIGERAEAAGLFGSPLSADSLRQLAHEVRTPLNAIAGFAEMIERQMLGPASVAYRQRAAAILTETRELETVLDDLHQAALLEAGAVRHQSQEIDCGLLLARLATALNPLAEEKGVALALAIAPSCAPVLLDPSSAERMVSRLLSAAIGLARAGERIGIGLSPGSGDRPETCVSVGRPKLVADYDEQALFDACDVEGEEEGAPPTLGLGFTLRLVRSLVESCGGRLAVAPTVFRLHFPAAGAVDGPDEAPTRVAGGSECDWTMWVSRNGTGTSCQSEDSSAIAPGPGGPVAQR
ncbi:MAG TPA: HAMP domain-containing sensor histidine kinase [Sphingomonas sp.]|nr:HAMP domain-containing sensor histidine kinase [Sphingomonas sp.]